MFKNRELINNLNWNYSDEVQNKAIEKLSKLSIKDIKYLIQPNGTDCWDNAAIVIKNILETNEISSEEEEKSLLLVMDWTKDLNWPGALTIVEALKALPEDVFKRMIQKSYMTALEDKDGCWVYSLSSIIRMLGYEEENDLTINYYWN